jgi:C4-dicarboxylate transporter DctQ subunit
VMWTYWRHGQLPHHEIAHVDGLDEAEAAT